MKIVSRFLTLTMVGCYGCGGGGPSGSTTSTAENPTVISESNKKQVATVALQNDLRTLSAINGNAVAVVPANSETSRPVWSVIGAAFLRAGNMASSRIQFPVAAIKPGTLNCGSEAVPSGVIQVLFDDVNNDGDYSAGDKLDLIFNQCLDSSDGSIANGKIVFVFRKVVGLPLTGPTPWSFTSDLSFTNFEQLSAAKSSVKIDGTMSWSQNQKTSDENSVIVSGEKLSVLRSDDSVRISSFSITFDENASTKEYREFGAQVVSSTKLGGTIGLDIPRDQPLKGIVPGFPNSGVLKITGKESATSLTAIDSTNVRIDLDSNADNHIDSSENVSRLTLLGS